MEGLTPLIVLIIAAAVWILFVALIFWATEHLCDRFHNLK